MRATSRTDRTDAGDDPAGTHPAARRPRGARARELVVVDAGVPELEVLLADLAERADPGLAVVVLEGGAADPAEALARLGDAFAGHEGLGTVHVVPRREGGALSLAGQRVATLDLLAGSETVASVGDALADGASLLLHGCDAGAGADEGAHTFADALALAIGAIRTPGPTT